MCVQPARPGPRTGPPLPSQASGEDCLFLNVWTPATSSRDHLPVVVWLHGGNFSVSSGSQTDGSSLARRGVVVVTLNYRLGALGYLAHPALSRESSNGVSGNYGLLDQIAALQWVRANIAAFGGDPGKVTLMGQSAGATSAIDLMVAPAARGLFHQIIVHSAGGSFGSQTSLASEEQQGATLVSDLAAFRAMPAEDVIARLPQASAMRREGHFYPNMDGHVLPKDVLAAAMSDPSRVPLLMGTNRDEALFWARDLPATLSAYPAYLSEWFVPQIVDSIAARYTAATDGEVPAISARLATDFKIAAPTLEFARARARYAPVYLYRFSRVSPTARMTFGGAAHGVEVPYAFGTVTTTANRYEERDEALSQEMTNAWANFIKTGDPNGEGVTSWPVFGIATETLLEFGNTTRQALADSETASFFRTYPPQPEK